jgi:hypothetical protein
MGHRYNEVFLLQYGACCFTLAIDRLELFIYLFIYSWQAFVKGKFIFQNGQKEKKLFQFF